ncbi:serine/threonine protein kinase [Pseudanabaena sp. UWO310]|uniref:serine/threonine protein kinase n=1 Tax=Pseudanabaena sp. UWO310 TaxID=2480795 RepID=UPI0011575161|nr:serine/threonine-protein kinase [Pseudanabaena sp. UWO310]TYQ31993.1 serine/threonine protein kinase [Pseudanabaena sp. UWO310]
MSAFPDFAVHGYQVIKELGHNLEGGRFTYLAKRLADNVDVAIKQFQFATGSGWDGFRAIEREIQSLQGLNHRGIPKYLDKFETDNGYCLVTEYFPADTLAAARSFMPDQIKQIAVQLLEILVYLQERMPSVIHRDVKPENILVDNNLNVYLIDFGFARVGSGSVAMSSANAGTFGFMAPEQIRNLKLTNASDLYGLGLTLICLIGAIRSTDIGNYIDFSNQLDRSKIDPKLKGCSLTFVKWLDQMVEPDPSKRFAEAKTALDALKPLYVVRVPEVKFFRDGVEFDPSKTILEFKATNLGEKLTQTITLINSIPETILEGHWEVDPHPNDPPHSPDNHSWISFNQKKFEGNHVDCEIVVDTSKLIAQGKGQRKINIYLNTARRNYSFKIAIETATLPIDHEKFSIKFMAQLLIVVALSGQIAVGSMLFATSVLFYGNSSANVLHEYGLGLIILIFMIILATMIGAIALGSKAALRTGYFAGVAFLIIFATVEWSGVLNSRGLFRLLLLMIVCLLNFVNQDRKSRFTLLSGLTLGFFIGCIYSLWIGTDWLTSLDINWWTSYGQRVFSSKLIVVRAWLSSNSLFIYGGTIASASWLGYLLFYPSIERQRKISAYRRKEEHLIKP